MDIRQIENHVLELWYGKNISWLINELLKLEFYEINDHIIYFDNGKCCLIFDKNNNIIIANLDELRIKYIEYKHNDEIVCVKKLKKIVVSCIDDIEKTLKLIHNDTLKLEYYDSLFLNVYYDNYLKN